MIGAPPGCLSALKDAENHTGNPGRIQAVKPADPIAFKGYSFSVRTHFLFEASARRFSTAPVAAFALAACGLFSVGAGAEPPPAVPHSAEAGRAETVAPADADAAPVARSVSDEPFRCPGTNAAFFEEIKEAGWVGFGETWDFNTCGEGITIYGEGATKAWPAFRSQRPRPVLSVRPSGKPVNVQFYATVLPWVAFGTIGVVIGLAWLLSILTRRKRITLVDVPCPKCAAEIPVPLNDPDSKSLFCPACGGASVIVVTDADGVAHPEVTVLA